jgi:sedoheptulokinase
MDTTLVNIGTAGQVTVRAERPIVIPNIETRLHIDDSYLLMGGSLCAGKAYALLKDFVAGIGKFIFEQTLDDSRIYERLERIDADLTDLRCQPTFLGTRSDPLVRGEISNITEDNLTIGDLVHALFQGVAEELFGHYRRMRSPRRFLVGSGNGIKRNPGLRRAVERTFGQEILVPEMEETAAFGAALVACVGLGVFESFDAAARSIRYALPRT